MNLKVLVVLILLTTVLFISACGTSGPGTQPYQSPPSGGGCGVNFPSSDFEVSDLIQGFDCG